MFKLQSPNVNTRLRQLIGLAVIISYFVLALPPVSAQGPTPDPRFGAVEAFRDPVAAAEANVGWDRILFYWSELQPNGPDEWNGYHVPDDWLRLAAEANREVVGLLKHTPHWATDDHPLCSPPRGLDLPIDDPGNLWATFVRRVVGTYAGRVDRWVIWNEPDIESGSFGYEWCGSMEEYYRLLKVAYLAAHQANPNVKIHLAGATTWHNPVYLHDFLAVATQDPEGAEHGYFFDVVTLHIYFRTETIPEIVRAARATLAAYGLQRPIWINETNAPSNLDAPYWELPNANFDITLEEQASFLLQAFSLALNAGAERIAVYKWMDNEPQPGVEPFGIIRTDYSRRPAYEACRLITTHYAGTLSTHKDRQPLYTIVTLNRGQLTTRVLWARTEQDVTLSLPALAPQARLIDQTGEEEVLEPADAQYTLTLPGARCADRRGCIIGGPTYLLIEQNGHSPPPATAAAATIVPDQEPTEAPAATVTLTHTATATTLTPPITGTDTLSPTATPTEPPTEPPTETPTATPSPTATPTELPSPTPTATATNTATPTSTSSPTPSPSPTAAPTSPARLSPNPTSRSLLLGLTTVLAATTLAYVLINRRRQDKN